MSRFSTGVRTSAKTLGDQPAAMSTASSRSIRPRRKAPRAVDRWLDWTLSTLQPVDRPVFWALVRTPVEKRDMVAIQKDVDAEAVVWRIPEALLASRRFIEGDQFTIADIAIGAFARRWFGVEGVSKPKLPNLERWYAQISERPGFAKFIAPPMS